MITIRRAEFDDWAVSREVRLAALLDSPLAFGSTYEREVHFNETTWRERVEAADRATFLAFADNDEPAIGTAVGVPNPDALAGDRELMSMWVAPAMRGQRVAQLLVEAVADWAREQGAQTLSLWVVVGNQVARAVYEHAGFTAVGEPRPMPAADGRMEEQLIRLLEKPHDQYWRLTAYRRA